MRRAQSPTRCHRRDRYQYHFPHEDRHTADIDLAVALDLDDFAGLKGLLQAAGWTQTPKLEHRWHGPRGTPVDLVPAGRNLRNAKEVTWPESQFRMSLVGFDHVFSDAKPAELDGELILQVIPVPVLVLLKIVAVLELSQIEAVLETGAGTPDLVQLKGRLQWITMTERWETMPEKPDSHWGVAKQSGSHDPRVAYLQSILEAEGYRIGWANENRVNTTPKEDREIIYDADGYYFCKKDRPFDQILVRSPQK